MQASQLQWDPTCTNILFHVLDDPGHGIEFNDSYLDSKDNYFNFPPSGRRDPHEEICEALRILKVDCNVKK